jgi:geranylgeranyl reductase family protein
MASHYDILIIGAGPAGGSCAFHLASRGFRVALIEKFGLPRFKPCGGAVPRVVFQQLPFLSPLAERSVALTKVTYTFQGKEENQVTTGEAKVYTVERMLLDYEICSEAIRQGAELIEKKRVLALEENVDVVSARLDDGVTLTGRYAVAASGGFSILPRSINGFNEKNKLYGCSSLLYLVPDDAVMEKYRHMAHIDFAFLKDGYGGIIPGKNLLALCLYKKGLASRDYLRHKTEEFMKLLELRGKRIFFNAIPMELYCHRRNLNTRRIFLAGEAASLVDPLSGEGIRHAVDSGRIAAEVVEALLVSNNASPADYTARIHRKIGKELMLAHKFARLAHLFPRITYGGLIHVSEEAADVLNGNLSYNTLLERLKGRVLRLAGRILTGKRSQRTAL